MNTNEMKYNVTYTYTAASGAPVTKTIKVETREAADEICERIEALVDAGYRLNDITREVYDD